MLSCGPADLATAQTGDLGNLRPRVPNNTAEHSRQDLDVLRADLPAIGRGRSTYGVAARVVAEGRARQSQLLGDDGDNGDVWRDWIGVRKDAAAELRAADALIERL